MSIQYPDVSRFDFYDASELHTDSTVVYLTTTVVSTVAPNIVNVTLSADGEGILTSRDHPVAGTANSVSPGTGGFGDFVDITGTSGGAGDGTFTVNTVLSDTQFTINGTVGNSTGGSVNFRFPAGAWNIGYDDAGRTYITHNNVQDALTDLDNAIHSSSGVVVGKSIVDFGPTGASDIRYAVTGQTGILANSIVQAWITPITTTDHSVDEHRVEEIQADADSVMAGVGFTIFVRTRNVALRGKWTVAWMWQ